MISEADLEPVRDVIADIIRENYLPDEAAGVIVDMLHSAITKHDQITSRNLKRAAVGGEARGYMRASQLLDMGRHSDLIVPFITEMRRCIQALEQLEGQ